MKVAVVVHAGKPLGGGPEDLRVALKDAGVDDPDWREADSSKKAGKEAHHAIKAGADVLFVWGGDGTVQRVADAAAGTDVALAILPAGTANLLAHHLTIPSDIARCVDVGLGPNRRRIDLGVVNGEHFAVMAGVGVDALLMHQAKRGLKSRFGRLAYLRAGAKAVQMPHFEAAIRVGGKAWLRGPASCVLVGNLGALFGGITVFDHARDDDGRLELGVMTGDGTLAWARALTRTIFRRPGLSPFLELTAGRKIAIELDRPMAYEVDGSVRDAATTFEISVARHALTLCVP
ncbi:MAG: diacylglycerol/lipid kinase family protein [Thermoplasmatota archaeon]